MIDIHSHILPARDDGASTLEESLLMARQAVEGGTNIMFATPHVMDRRDLDRAREVPDAVATLQMALLDAQIPLTLLPGAEVYPMEGLLEAIDEGVPLLMGKQRKVLLLDSPLTALPLGLDDWVYALQAAGMQVILAHPERVGPIQDNPQCLEPLVHRGLLLQVNASSLLGSHGQAASDTAQLLLRHRWVQFLASDCHSSRRRRPGLARVQPALAHLVGNETADILLNRNGQRLVDGVPVPCDPLPFTGNTSQRGIFNRIFRRGSRR